jgi:prepilin-type N-terminal cleavage/methylation domain-containing protein
MLPNPSSPSEAGFTLLEVLLALAALVVVATTLAVLIERSLSNVRDAREQSTSVALAREKLSELRASSGALTDAPPNALDTDTGGFVDYVDRDGRPTAGNVAQASFVRRWSVRSLPGAPAGLRVVRVLVQNARVRGHSLAGSVGNRVLLTTLIRV